MDSKFRLQKVLEYRERLLEQEKLKLGALMQKDRELNEELQEKNNEITVKEAELQTFQQANKFAFVKLGMDFIRKLEGQRNYILQTIRTNRKEIEIQRGKTTQAMNDVKIMEKLKERHSENYLEYVKKEEMKLIDELSVTRHTRNGN